MLVEATSSTVESSSTTLDSSDFLELLMVQYQNQDPLEPVSDTESLAQMAEFSSLEIMNQMLESESRSQMYSLLGNNITYSVVDESTGLTGVYEGTVESVITSGGSTQLVVNGDYIDLSDVVQVSSSSSSTEEADA
jgi:flagellar basal-body rod modification protein FlgD